MMNYIENTHSSTHVPSLPVLCIQNQELATEPRPVPTKQQGHEAGQADARRVLAEAEQSKGAPLTEREMREAIHPLFMARLEESKTSNKGQAWYHGWCQGYILALLEAERQAKPLPGTDLQEEVVPVPGTLTFRKAVIQTESMDDLKPGILCGQDCFVDLHCENPSITSKQLAMLFIEFMSSDEPEPFNVGFLMGFVDALLRARKTYPLG